MRPIQQQPLPAPRRAQVLGVGNDGSLIVRYGDSFQGGAPFPAPRMGSTQSGFHTVPLKDANMLVLAEGYGHGLPVGGISISDTLPVLASHPALVAGEGAIFGPRGDVLSYATATGPSVVYRSADHTISITVDPATSRVNIAATGGLWINGQQVTVP